MWNMKKNILYILTPVVLIIVSLFAIYLNNPTYKAEAYIDGWGSTDMYLPKDQIPFFAEHFSEVKDILAHGLVNPNSDIKQRTAYVIDELGVQAKSLETNILDALKAEPDRTVRLYHYRALRSIGAGNNLTLTYLKDRFQILSEQQDGPYDGEYYKVSDERIKLSATLFVLDDDLHQRSIYLNEVTQWLNPPNPSLSQSELEAYWDHRWCAVIAVEFMKGAEEAIPLLEAMLCEQSTKQWVSVHVPRALKSLRGEPAPVEGIK